MKKFFSRIMLFAVAATALASCAKDAENTPIDNKEKLIEVTLKAEKPATVRTEIIEGVPYWSEGDQVGVYVCVEDETEVTYKNYAFTNDSEEATLTTTFTGKTALANTLYPYYPYTSNGATEKGAKVELPANQNPTATSFDGKADIMIAKPITLDADGTQLENLEFARVGAIVKIVLKDKTSSLAGQHLSSLTMTAESNLAGRVYLDVINQQLGELYYGQSKSVTATYTEDTQFEINDENAVYVIVYPQTLAEGTTLAFEASTEGYAITKNITVPEGGIALEMGKLTTLNVSLNVENIVAEATGLALPFEDDFSWITSNTETDDISASVNGELYSAASKIYPLKSANPGKGLKFGTSSVAGSLTTVELDLSQPFTVVFDAKKYDTGSKFQVTAGTQVLATVALTDTWETYTLEFDAVDAKEQIKIEVIGGNRAYLDNLKVVAGHNYVLPPVLTVSTDAINSVSHEGATETFTYNVANPVEGTNVVISDNVDWITTSDASGTVTVTIAANDAEEAREGAITVTYGDLTKTIAVSQNAKPAEGYVVDILNLAFTGTANNYADWSGKTGKSGAVYAGQSAGGYNSIQIRTKNNNSGIVTTTSGGTAKKIVVTWNSNTVSGRTLDIYGKNTAYSAATDLYDASTQGTKLGSIVCGTSTELVIDGDYQYIGLRSNSDAMYLDEIQITWEGSNMDNDNTDGDTTTDPVTITLDCTSQPFTTKLPEGSNNASTTTTTYTDNSGYRWTIASTVGYYFNTSGYLMCKPTSYVTMPVVEGQKLTSISLYCNKGASTAVKYTIVNEGNDTVIGAELTGVADKITPLTWDLTNTTESTAYRIKTANKNGQITKIVLSYM